MDGQSEALAVHGLAATALAELWQRVPESERERVAVDFIPELRALVPALYDHPGKPWTVAAMAHLACCSEGHLSRLFQRHLGTSPMA
jgi:transcriptional regulator GlxA family with amidase domain